jgi:hypothetical protein
LFGRVEFPQSRIGRCDLIERGISLASISFFTVGAGLAQNCDAQFGLIIISVPGSNPHPSLDPLLREIDLSSRRRSLLN